MKITEPALRKMISETIKLDLEVGDIILTGRFKNKRTKVKKIGTDKLGQPTINGRSALKFRIEKNMPEDKWSKKTKEAAAQNESLVSLLRGLIQEEIEVFISTN